MKKFLMALALTMVTTLSYAFEQSVHIFDHRTGGPVTSATTEIGAFLTLKDISDLPGVKDNEPLTLRVIAAWGVNPGESIFNLITTSKVPAYVNIATPHYKGSVVSSIGVYTVPKSYPVPMRNIFSQGIVANFAVSLESSRGEVIQKFNVASNFSRP